MSRSQADIKKLIKRLEDAGFNELRKVAEKRRAQLYRHDSYSAALVAKLAPSIKVRIPYPSARPSIASDQLAGILPQSLRYHCEPSSKLKGDERVADKLELFFAHCGHRLIEPLQRATVSHQVKSFAAFWWLSYDGFALPKEASKREEYRRKYWPFQLDVIDPLSVVFLADDSGKPTIAGREFEMSYADIARIYGGAGVDDDPLIILGEKFPYLRGGRGVAPDSDAGTIEKARVCVINDGRTEAHYIDIKTKKGEYERFQEAGEWPNPFGRVPLFIITGKYNPDATELVDIFQPLNVDVLREQEALDTHMTQAASIAFTPSQWNIVPPDTIIERINSGEFADWPAGEIVPGALAERGYQLPAEFWRTMDMATQARDAALPPPYLTNPDPAVVKGAPASAQLSALTTANRIFDAPRESFIKAVHDVMTALVHFMCGGYKDGGYGTEKTKLSFRATGKEATSKYMADRKGEEFGLTEEDFGDFENDFTLEITPIEETDSQKALRFELMSGYRAAGLVTMEDLLSVVTEDVSGKKQELEEEGFYQEYAPVYEKAFLVDSLRVIKEMSGIDLSYLFLPIGIGAEGQQPAGASADNGDAAGDVGGYRMDAPSSPMPNVGVTA